VVERRLYGVRRRVQQDRSARVKAEPTLRVGSAPPK
jgi:hypothetical protein